MLTKDTTSKNWEKSIVMGQFHFHMYQDGLSNQNVLRNHKDESQKSKITYAFLLVQKLYNHNFLL
jgi:hypothetical protein